MKGISMVWGAALLLGLCAEQSCARRQRDWCPETCGTLGNVPGNWNVYRSVEPLSRCNQTMLVSFNVFNDLNKDDTTVHIGACTANVTNHSLTGRYASSHSSKSTLRSRTGLSRSIYENVTDAANSTTPTWATNTTEVVNIEVLSAGTNGSHSASDIVSAATALQQMLTMDSQATEKTLLVAYSNGATVGVYAGERIGNDGTNDLLQKLIDTTNHGDTAETVVMQVCGKQRNAREILGLVANTGTTNVDLGTIQNALASWSTAKCATLDNSLQSSESITLYQTPLVAAVQARGTPTELVARATCSAIQVVSGDSCSSLATECGISGDVFTEYNSASDECSTLAVGEWVCCSAGTLPDLSPSAYDNGTCYTYYVQSGDSCSALAASYSLTIDDIETYNENTWGWMGCDDLLADMNICLSAGDGPMPASMANAECGPQVPGTDYPTNSASLALLNPCPLNACCDIWGQCGVTDEFCTISNSTTGAPGTALPGENGCISNCGTEIINNNEGPSEYIQIAYFEGFNWDRPCLNLEATDIPSSYTHVHFAFANLTDDYDVAIGDDQLIQWNLFLGMTAYKRVISIGGWGFSTDPSTYNIFREAVTDDNRATLISNVVAFVEKYNLDGVDFDWEYPGEPDIEGIPAGNDDDGVNYVYTLRDLKEALTEDVSLSFAAPASYWYLKQFEIESMSTVVDYIVYMTYDLHGQWDYGDEYADQGCPAGGCLRSHVNMTETYTALSMITKAGVSSNKIAVGVSSYGRSFQMTDSSCTGPECSFTGPDSGAEPGLCTETPGYISNTEINNIINNSSISSTTALDDLSNSNILIWDDNWVAYMDDENKAARMAAYQALNFLGTSDWAVDLQDLESSTGLVLTELSTSSSSTQICKMTYTTSGAKTTLQDAGSIASSTWSASGAGLYLDEVLQTNGTAGWLLGFFETVVDCGASPGGTVYDCSDIMSSTCEEPKSCDTYCPSQAYFVHYSIWQFFHFYQQFKLNIQGMALVEIATTINIISDTFAPPDTSASELYSILGGVLTTLAGLGTFVGDFELDALGAASDGLAAFAAMFADTALGGDDEDDTTEELDEILGSTLESVFGAVNKTINTVLNPGYDADISMIESFFTGGAFLDYQVVDWSIKAVTAAFNNTMNTYFVIAAMHSASDTGPYSSGYCFLYSDDDDYSNEEGCNGTGSETMIWYDNICIGFGTYTETVSGGQNGVPIFQTGFLDGDQLDKFVTYVKDINLAIVNNYDCYLSPTSNGQAEFPTSFDPTNPVVYPDCFFNFEAYPITEIG